MGVIARNNRIITLFCHPSHHLTTKCIALAKASKAEEVQVIEIDKLKVTGTVWAEIADLLGVSIQELISKNHPSFLKHHSNSIELDNVDAIKILQNYPEVLAYPIAVRADKAVQAKNSTDIMKLHYPDSKDAKLP